MWHAIFESDTVFGVGSAKCTCGFFMPSAVAAGAGESGAVASLVANPLQKAATITVTPVAGDQIIIPDEEAIYTYKVKGETGSWRKGGKSVSLPSSFAVGKGFWYVRAADGAATEISWAAVN